MNTNLAFLLCFSVIYNCNAASVLKLKSGNNNININKIKVDVISFKTKLINLFDFLFFFNSDFYQYRKARGKLRIQLIYQLFKYFISLEQWK